MLELRARPPSLDGTQTLVLGGKHFDSVHPRLALFLSSLPQTPLLAAPRCLLFLLSQSSLLSAVSFPAGSSGRAHERSAVSELTADIRL